MIGALRLGRNFEVAGGRAGWETSIVHSDTCRNAMCNNLEGCSIQSAKYGALISTCTVTTTMHWYQPAQ